MAVCQKTLQLGKRESPALCHCRPERKTGRIPPREAYANFIAAVLCPLDNAAQIHVTGDGVSGVAEYAPYPKYSDVARRRRWAGNGMFGCHLRPDGSVVSVEVLKSTGYDVLDQAAIVALRQWHFKVSGGHLVRVPVKFAMRGGSQP